MSTQTSEMIEVKQEELNETEAFDLAEKYADHTRLFISNIKKAGNQMNDFNIKLEKEDINLQKSLFEILKPHK